MKPESERTVSTPEACEILHCGRSTIYNRGKQDPAFPRPIKIGRATCWYVHELRAYVAACASRREPSGQAEKAVA